MKTVNIRDWEEKFRIAAETIVGRVGAPTWISTAVTGEQYKSLALAFPGTTKKGYETVLRGWWNGMVTELLQEANSGAVWHEEPTLYWRQAPQIVDDEARQGIKILRARLLVSRRAPLYRFTGEFDSVSAVEEAIRQTIWPSFSATVSRVLTPDQSPREITHKDIPQDIVDEIRKTGKMPSDTKQRFVHYIKTLRVGI